ncbi:MAG: hypothetical protein LBK77_04675 [Spirochaetaceae bacterium]|jgi:hypothetical protein|nr:hypothetical protein [Spirochaetaceae bacterium]
MMNRAEYQKAFDQALNLRAGWLEKTEVPKFKEEIRTFHNAFEALYKLLIQKKLINEDPYKQEAKIGEIRVPPPIQPDGDRKDQLTMNLSAYDNQLDFLVNFFQISIDFLTLENIKRILALVKYIDWAHFTTNTQSATTKAVVDVVNQARIGSDPLTANMINESLDKLNQGTGSIIAYLREATGFNREFYKLELRQNITASMNDASVEAVRKKFSAAMPGKPFYPDLIEELIREDFSPGGEQLRSAVLQQLAVPENKPRVVKKEVSVKTSLLEGLTVISSTTAALGDIIPRLDENNMVFQNRRQTFGEKLRELFRQMLNREPAPVIYNIEYIDPAKGASVKETVNFYAFRPELDKKLRFFASLGGRGGAAASRLEAMEEKPLLALLEKALREAQGLHRTLFGLDEYFKAEAPRESREKIKGIKPELGTLKNAIIKANQKRHEYSAQLEEEEQLKRLGVTPVS